jgi:plastocyanin
VSARGIPACACLTALLAATGCGGSSGGGSSSSSSSAPQSTPKPAAAGPALKSATIDIKSFKFKPVAIAVQKGGRLTWTNSDSAAHTATADDRSFDTQTIDQGKSKSVSFSAAGTFAYHCDFHPFMKAMVVVK